MQKLHQKNQRKNFVPVVLVLVDTRSAEQHAARAFNLPVYKLESLLTLWTRTNNTLPTVPDRLKIRASVRRS